MRVDLAFGKSTGIELTDGFRYRLLEARFAVPLSDPQEANGSRMNFGLWRTLMVSLAAKPGAISFENASARSSGTHIPMSGQIASDVVFHLVAARDQVAADFPDPRPWPNRASQSRSES